MAAARSGWTDDPASLEARIQAAEAAVVARDARVRARVEHYAERAKSGTVRAIAYGGAAAVAATLAGRWLLGRRASAHGHDKADHDREREHRRRYRRDGILSLPWLQILAVAWPLLPLSLTSRVHPGFARLFLGVGGPGAPADGHVAAPDLPQPPPTVERVDLPRYMGQWFEIARLPQQEEAACSNDITATYMMMEGCIQIRNECRDAGGTLRSSAGVGRVVMGSHGAQLKVCFAPKWLQWLPWVWADYWVLGIDDDYQSALVGTPDRTGLWILARTPTLPLPLQDAWVEYAEALGFDTATLIRTPHSAWSEPGPESVHVMAAGAVH